MSPIPNQHLREVDDFVCWVMVGVMHWCLSHIVTGMKKFHYVHKHVPGHDRSYIQRQQVMCTPI